MEIKRWAKKPPAVGDVRPARCPSCDAAGAPLGERVVIVGHGLRARKVVAPVDHAGGRGRVIELRLRRYRCRACEAVLTVVPLGVLFRRRFAAFAIAWALALFGLLKLAVTAVRERVTTWQATAHTTNLAWASLRRWARAVRDQKLFPGLPRASPDAPLRRVAERTAMALAAECSANRRELSEDIRAGYGGVAISLRAIAA